MIRFSLQVAVYLIALSFLLLGGSHAEDLQGIRSIRDLDQASILHYAIFSDNKGESPASSVEFARMADWVRAGESAFVVGVGDHLKYGWENSFIPWIRSDAWWRDHTFLNVADGENQFYGDAHEQSDYGAGSEILDLVRLDAHADILRPNPSEYYARIPAGDRTVHMIQVHFSDQPKVDSLAFPESSRKWLMDTLDGIEKGSRDHIVIAAHSRAGSWDMVLSPDRRRRLLAKADLVLSATTHRYQSWVPEAYVDGSAVCVNTGAVNFPGTMTPNGYVEIHVLKSGSIVGQYMDLTRSTRDLQRGRFAWIKPIDGPMRHIDLRPAGPDENMDAQVAALRDSITREVIDAGLVQLLKEKTGAELVSVGVRTGLARGPVTREDAWWVFGRNKNFRVVRVPADRIGVVFSRLKQTPFPVATDPVRVATTQSTATRIIGQAGLTSEALEPLRADENSLRQVDLLLDWLKSVERQAR